MTALRFVVAGMVGSGKTTLVQTISDQAAVQTERPATDTTAQLKSTTTVAMDFSPVVLPPQRYLHIYGVPGQERFEFMWDIAISTADICLVLVAAHRPQYFAPTRWFMESIGARARSGAGRERAPAVYLGITHSDCPVALSPAAILAAVTPGSGNLGRPVVTLDPRCKVSILEAIAAIVDSFSSGSNPLEG